MSTTLPARTALLVASGGLAALGLTACSSSAAAPSAASTSSVAGVSSVSTPSLPAASTVSPAAVVATTTPSGTPTSAPSTAPSTTPPDTAADRLSAATTAWKDGASAPSAELNRYLQRAVADLTAAKTLGVTNPAAYTTALTELRQIEAVPETDTTAAQRATVRTDTVALNTFFGTPGLYGFAAP